MHRIAITDSFWDISHRNNYLSLSLPLISNYRFYIRISEMIEGLQHLVNKRKFDFNQNIIRILSEY